MLQQLDHFSINLHLFFKQLFPCRFSGLRSSAAFLSYMTVNELSFGSQQAYWQHQCGFRETFYRPTNTENSHGEEVCKSRHSHTSKLSYCIITSLFLWVPWSQCKLMESWQSWTIVSSDTSRKKSGLLFLLACESVDTVGAQDTHKKSKNRPKNRQSEEEYGKSEKEKMRKKGSREEKQIKIKEQRKKSGIISAS